MEEISTDQLVYIIGKKEIELEYIRKQLHEQTEIVKELTNEIETIKNKE